MVGLGSGANLEWEQASSEGKRSWGKETDRHSKEVEQEHMVMSGGNGGAEEVGDDSWYGHVIEL